MGVSFGATGHVEVVGLGINISTIVYIGGIYLPVFGNILGTF